MKFSSPPEKKPGIWPSELERMVLPLRPSPTT
jgi:hypothetical protein